MADNWLDGIKNIWTNDSEIFIKAGGDDAMFWAGRMSIAAGWVINSSIHNISDCIKLLTWVKNQYDNIIFIRTDNYKYSTEDK
jgi:hypothetical protein